MQILSDTFQVTEYINNWKERPADQINNLFQVFIETPTPNNRFQSNSGYPNQWSRILGIDYGNVSSQLVSAFQDLNTPISMHLAVVANRFTVIWSSGSDANLTYYGVDPVNGGRILDIQDAPTRNADHAHRGISIELRNQLAYNWLVSPYTVSDLFHTLTFPDYLTDTSQRRRIRNTGEQCLVRAHSYPILGGNRAILKELADHGHISNASFIRIRFGVNPSDKFLDKDLFTLIVELIPNNAQGEPNEATANFLDFVGACPPCPQPASQQ
ncbi:MAG: hypothetical protein F6K11_10955 [Leptolyngbya sp. SIO3F4]|nr:hypothetical protein [Leptolyngbya sp. SIO3F4]